MDKVQEAFVAPTKDSGWIGKLAMGSLASFFGILILPLVVYVGYLQKIIRNNIEQDNPPLPDWGDLGGYFKSGIPGFLAGLLYNLVPLGLFVGGGASFFAGLILGSRSNSGGAFFAGAGLAMTLMCVGGFLLLILTFWFPMVLLRVTVTNRVSSAFEFGEIWRDITRAPGEYLMIPAIGYGVGILAGAVGGWIPLVGPFLIIAATVYTNYVMAAMLGQYYRKTLAQSPAALPAESGFTPEGI